MKLKKLPQIISMIFVLLFFFSCACSNDKDAVQSDFIGHFQSDESLIINQNRNIIAIYEAVINPESGFFEITPTTRTSAYHFPLSDYYNVLTITDFGWLPNFWADIKLTHPYPGSGIDGFDPRVIAILPANPSVSFNYPIFNAFANNSVLLEPDGYTKLFDELGGSIPGNTNPFKAYFKEQPNRVWLSTGETEETQRWEMDLAGFGGPLSFIFVVDVTTNYPMPPQPVIDNAPEPVQINVEVGDGLTANGGNADIDVTLLDWQGQAGIKIKIEAPDLFNNSVQLLYSEPGQNPDEYIFSGAISNDLLSPSGEYNILVAVWDILTGVHVFKEATVLVEEEPTLNPVIITTVETDDSAVEVVVSDGYAYVADYDGGLQIIDIDPPESASIINSVPMNNATGLDVDNGYAFVATNYDGLQIVDIDPIESAYIVKTIETEHYANKVIVSNGYAYISDESRLTIIDIDPLDSAHIVSSVITCNMARRLCLDGGYAYLANTGCGVMVVDVSPPETAHFVKQIWPPTTAKDIEIVGDLAYVSNFHSLEIIDIEPLESAHIINTVSAPGYSYGLCVSGGYVYYADYHYVQIIDINPPESAYIVATIDTPGKADDVLVVDNFAYVPCRSAGLCIIQLW